MSFFGNKPITRRAAIAVAMTSCAMVRSGTIAARQTDRPAPFDLGHGLEIRDYRLFPTEDVMRFIVEIHNTTDTAVDTPTIGVVLPHLEDNNFGWANPVSVVLHPHTSDCLIGVAPQAVDTNEDWGTPEWMLCSSIETLMAESIQDWEYQFTHSVEVLDDTHARTTAEVTNHNNEIPPRPILQGLVWDADDRLAGALLPISLATIAPGETKELVVNSIPGSTFLANPFALLDSVDGAETYFSIQPGGTATNRGCDVAMPWNRRDSVTKSED